MAGRGDEVKAETFEIVERIAERVNFKFAAVARAGVDLAYGEASPRRRRADEWTFSANSASCAFIGGRRPLGQRPGNEVLNSEFAIRGRAPSKNN